MGVPTSEVGYTSAMPRREDHEVHRDMWGLGERGKKHTHILESQYTHDIISQTYWDPNIHIAEYNISSILGSQYTHSRI